MPYKPGWKSSEFWFTLVSFIFSGLFLLGVIGDNDQKEELIRDVSHGVESVILIAGQAIILYKYINSRKELKKLPNEEKTDESEPEPEHQNSSPVNKPRSNKSRSRKTSSKSKRKPKNSSKDRPS